LKLSRQLIRCSEFTPVIFLPGCETSRLFVPMCVSSLKYVVLFRESLANHAGMYLYESRICCLCLLVGSHPATKYSLSQNIRHLAFKLNVYQAHNRLSRKKVTNLLSCHMSLKRDTFTVTLYDQMFSCT
jgi:hypothetical protein